MKTLLALAALASGLGIAAATADPAPLADRAAIADAATAIAAGADRHDWPRVRAAFAEEVTTDYTSLWGGDPVTQSADDLVAQWAAFLPGFDITQHLVTNLTVTGLSEGTATAEADFQATHRIGDDLWILGGRYSYALQKNDARWVVTSLTMTALWETGDRGLVQQASARAAER